MRVDLIMDNRYPQYIETIGYAADTVCLGLQSQGIPVQMAYPNSQTLRNIREATDSNGILELGHYYERQGRDRQICGAPDDDRTILLTPAALKRTSAGIRNCFGNSVERYSNGTVLGEGVASLSRYMHQQIGQSTGLAFTTLHEAGHLFGLYPHGNHCQCPTCTMQNEQNLTKLTSWETEQRLRTTPFCSSCSSNIRRR